MTEDDKLAMAFQMGQLWSAIKTLEGLRWDNGIGSPEPEKRANAALSSLRKAYNELADKRWQLYQQSKGV